MASPSFLFEEAEEVDFEVVELSTISFTSSDGTKFCESVASPYYWDENEKEFGPRAEWFGSVTSLWMTALGLIGLIVTAKSNDLLSRMLHGSLLMTGIGSCLFHGSFLMGFALWDTFGMILTLSLGTIALLDELFRMLFRSCCCWRTGSKYSHFFSYFFGVAYLLVMCSISASAGTAYRYGFALALVAMVGVQLTFLVYDFMYQFCGCYGLDQRHKWRRPIRIREKDRRKARIIGWIAIIVGVIGGVCWGIDNTCNAENIDEARKFALAHGFWHIFIGSFAFLSFFFIQVLRSDNEVGKVAAVSFKYKIFPLIQRVDAKEEDAAQDV